MFTPGCLCQPNTGKWRNVKLLKYLDGFYIVLPTDQSSVSSYKVSLA
jgi:hypothetical protein